MAKNIVEKKIGGIDMGKLTKEFSVAMNVWEAYFPVQVRLARGQVKRIVAGLNWAADVTGASSLNAMKEIAKEGRALTANVDSALRFDDQDFILITQKEYDKLTAKQA